VTSGAPEGAAASRSQGQHSALTAALSGAAIAYARRGCPIFPVAPRGKRPLSAHGLRDATTDTAVISGWWRRWPTANVGLLTGALSGLVVIDVDGDTGYRNFLDLQRRAGAPLPRTLWARTPRGGWHGYLQPPGEPIRNSVGKLGPGLIWKSLSSGARTESAAEVRKQRRSSP
jgi:hypothetical protein